MTVIIRSESPQVPDLRIRDRLIEDLLIEVAANPAAYGVPDSFVRTIGEGDQREYIFSPSIYRLVNLVSGSGGETETLSEADQAIALHCFRQVTRGSERRTHSLSEERFRLGLFAFSEIAVKMNSTWQLHYEAPTSSRSGCGETIFVGGYYYLIDSYADFSSSINNIQRGALVEVSEILGDFVRVHPVGDHPPRVLSIEFLTAGSQGRNGRYQ